MPLGAFSTAERNAANGARGAPVVRLFHSNNECLRARASARASMFSHQLQREDCNV
jgi:hypothetical protein